MAFFREWGFQIEHLNKDRANTSTSNNLLSNFWKEIWKATESPRPCNWAWQAFHNRMPTTLNLQSKISFIVLNVSTVMLSRRIFYHILYICPFAQEVRFLLNKMRLLLNLGMFDIFGVNPFCLKDIIFLSRRLQYTRNY